MRAVVGLMLMVVGGLLVLGALRGFAMLSPRRRRRSRQIAGEPFKRMLAAMLALGAVLVAAGYLMASSE